MKKPCRIAAAGLLLAAVCFVAYALGHPELSFPWSNRVTYALYGIYLAVMVLLFFASLPRRK